MRPARRIASRLADLIAIARDGYAFCVEASTRVPDPGLAALSGRMARSQVGVAGQLGTRVLASGGRPDIGGTLVGRMRALWARLRASLGDPRQAWVAELEQAQDRLLAFGALIDDPRTPEQARVVAVVLLPEVKARHDVMHAHRRAPAG